MLSVALQTLSGDNHFGIVPKTAIPQSSTPAAVTAKGNPILDEKQFLALQDRGFGFGAVELEEGGTCRIEINDCVNPNAEYNGTQPVKEHALELMRKVRESNPREVIIDLRDNHGGSPFLGELIASHFLEPDTPLSRFVYRNKLTGTDRATFPTGEYRSWSQDRLSREDRLLDTPVYILTGPETLSAAEDLAFHMQKLGRATFVGEPTGGRAHTAKLFDGEAREGVGF